MPFDEDSLDGISATLAKSIESEEELLTNLRSLEDLSSPSGFKNRQIDIDQESPEESELFFGKSGSKSAEDLDRNVIRVATHELGSDSDQPDELEPESEELEVDDEQETEEPDPDSDPNTPDEDAPPQYAITISGDFDGDHIDEFQTFLNEIVAKVEPVQRVRASAIVYAEGALDDYDLPIDRESDIDVYGVRLRTDEFEALIQEIHSDSGQVFISGTDITTEELTSDSERRFLDACVERISDNIEEFSNEH